MFKPIACYIGLRYTRAKRRNHFISFIALVSMLGIALGVAVLITVLSVMNGFDHEMRTKLFSAARHVVVRRVDGNDLRWESLAKRLGGEKHVKAVAPYVDGQAMLTHKSAVIPIMLTGILPPLETKVTASPYQMEAGRLTHLRSGRFGILLADKLADPLGLSVGERVTLITPKASLTPVGVLPRFKRFKIVGLFHAASNDLPMALIHLNDARKLFELGRGVSGLRLRVSGLYAAPQVAKRLRKTLPDYYEVNDWTKYYGQLFRAVRMEKTMMFLILFLIIIVAVFNLVSSLVMVVTDKRADIAILRTLGATPATVLAIFVVQGVIIGLTGTTLGIIGGILLSLNVTAVVSFIESLLHVQFLPASVYLIDVLPSQLLWQDVVKIGSLSLVLSLVATLYPAWQAARVQPAEALRYE